MGAVFKSAFDALGRSPTETALLKAKAELLRSLQAHIRTHATQAEAAEALGVTQPRISEMARGKIDLFSLDLLLQLCEQAGIPVEVRAGAALEVA